MFSNAYKMIRRMWLACDKFRWRTLRVIISLLQLGDLYCAFIGATIAVVLATKATCCWLAGSFETPLLWQHSSHTATAVALKLLPLLQLLFLFSLYFLHTHCATSGIIISIYMCHQVATAVQKNIYTETTPLDTCFYRGFSLPYFCMA